MSRTITISKEVYTIDELTQNARENAYNKFLEGNYYPWFDENEKTLKAFEKTFPVDVKDWQYGSYGYDFINFNFTDYDCIKELSGLRLAAYIWNHYEYYIFNRKYYWSKNPESKILRRSNIILSNDCVLTGYCTDNEILQPLYDFLNKPENISFDELMDRCLTSWLNACNDDYYNYTSMENFVSECNDNEWEFDESGDMI